MCFGSGFNQGNAQIQTRSVSMPTWEIFEAWDINLGGMITCHALLPPMGVPHMNVVGLRSTLSTKVEPSELKTWTKIPAWQPCGSSLGEKTPLLPFTCVWEQTQQQPLT